MSKTENAVRRLVAQGWTVDEKGNVIDPNGEVRRTRVNKGRLNPNTGNREPSYRRFNVTVEGSSFPVLVHKLVAFISEPDAAFVPGVHVRHLNGDSLDNAPSNIKAGTASENMLDKDPDVRHEASKTAARQLRRFSDVEVVDIRSSKESTTSLAKKIGCSKSTISNIRNFKLY